MNLRVAISDVLEIRRNLAAVGSFRGYRAVPVTFSAMVAFAAGGVQWWWQPSPVEFVVLWTAAAVLGFGTNLFSIARQYGASPRQWERSLAVVALSDLSPAVLAGALLTIVMTTTGRIDLLPGLWMVLFGTGILGSRRHLPYGCTLIGVAYLLAGTGTLYLMKAQAALGAGVMAGVFGAGQLLLAVVLARSQE
jgi:hypothetical protein